MLTLTLCKTYVSVTYETFFIFFIFYFVLFYFTFCMMFEINTDFENETMKKKFQTIHIYDCFHLISSRYYCVFENKCLPKLTLAIIAFFYLLFSFFFFELLNFKSKFLSKYKIELQSF